jgi:hypothetical protein
LDIIRLIFKLFLNINFCYMTSTKKFTDLVRSTSAELNLNLLLQQPVTELMGVSQDAASELHALGIETIFDLGSSSVFARAASALAAASTDFGLLPTDILYETAPKVPLTEIGELPIEHLRGISAADATVLTDVLDVKTVREFALWPQRQIAHEMVGTAAGTYVEEGEDLSAEVLRPRLGEFPTERVYYNTLIMLGTQQNGSLIPFTQPLSLGHLTDSNLGFGTPAVGALATYSQSWFVQGITLGHMVHSLALAPGEATRIAVIDWMRRTSATAIESIQESEQLDNSTLHARAVSEVQNAVASEMQSGGSITSGWAKSTSNASGLAASTGSGVSGFFEVAMVAGNSIGGSSNNEQAETNSGAKSTSWSVGSRSVLAQMNQQVNDRTEQHATSVRNRRASSVREVSQNEHEEVSTRIVANYNHMHALTIQYYEVVQIYRVSVQLNKFERVLFLPFELLDFSGPNAAQLVAYFRSQLLSVALTERIVALLLDDKGKVELRSAIRIASPISVGNVTTLNPPVALARMAANANTDITTSNNNEGSSGSSNPVSTPNPVTSIPIRQTVVRPGPIVEVLPGDARLIAISFEDAGIARIRIDQAGVPSDASTFIVPPSTDQVDFTGDILLRNVESINVARDASNQSQGSMIIRYETDGHESITQIPLALSDGDRMQKVAFLAGDAADRQVELYAHLQANRGYYTRAVLQRLDSASLVQLISGVSWQGKPLVDQVQPNPIAVTGNFLVLRAPAEEADNSGLVGDQSWGELLDDRKIDFNRQDVRLVPIPTGGVFAEAVLGRSNAAEKLDITRFWNWQDSPIPLLPPEISAVGTGTRATTEDLKPGQLSAPVLNVMQPTALPDPVGLSAVLGAIASGNMFRDMSGLAGTQAAAQAASAGTLAAATDAGRIASENFKAATTQATEMGKAAADMWKVMNSGDKNGSGGKSSAGISGDGARINHGRDLDQRGVSTILASGDSGSNAGSTRPPSTESNPIFGAASEIQKPSIDRFSRELAYSDESAAVSPQMIGATTTALGSTALGNSTAGQLGYSGVEASVAQIAWEQLWLTIFGDTAEAIGIDLKSVKLIPMRLHDNYIEFQLKYNAWTNDPEHIYVNIPMIIKDYMDAIANGQDTFDIYRDLLAEAVWTLQHEKTHVDQFKTNNNKPPANFADMIVFEEEAYRKNVTWIKSKSVRDFMLNNIETTPEYVKGLKDLSSGNQIKFNDWITSLHDETSRKSALISGNFLPKTIRGTANYGIGDLYITKS